MGSAVTTEVAWKIYDFPRLDEESFTSREVSPALLSRAESGSVYWEAPNPRRSFVRGAVYDGRGRIVDISQRKGGMNSDMVLSVNSPVLSARESAEARANAVPGRWLYAGSWMHGFGHFLVETLPTLWPLVDGYAEFDGICAHRFNSLRTFDWQFELVGLVSDAPIRVIDDDPMSVDELTVPSRAYHYQVAIDPHAERVWNLVGERATAGADTKDQPPVYLSRTRFQRDQTSRGIMTGREFQNSEEVDKVFEDAGFEVVFPETLSATQQVRLARTAPVLSGPSGSALHLSAFAESGARVIEVGDARTKSSLVSTQRAISSVKMQSTAQIPYAEREGGDVDTEAMTRSLEALLA